MTVKTFLKVAGTEDGNVVRICYYGSGPTCNRTLVTLQGYFSELWMGEWPKGKKTKILNSQIKHICTGVRPVDWKTRKKWYALTTIYIDWNEASA